MKQCIYALLSGVLLFSACGESKKQSENAEPAIDYVVDTEATARLDSTLGAFVDAGSIAGISALIFEKDKEVYFNAFGYLDRADGIPFDRNTLVKIYSMTKPVTGTALMTLHEKGAFDLDDPLSKYLPEYANMQVYTGVDENGEMILEPAKRQITIRDITRHTAGFANSNDIPVLGDLRKEVDAMNRENTLTQMSAKLASLPLYFHPGEKWEYGPCVDVQAYLVEKISGQPYGEYVRANVLDPLGMSETRYFVPEEDRGRFSAMYRRSDEGVLTQLDNEEAHSDYFNKWPLTRGGSGLTSTVDNYMRFARMLVNEGTFDGATILQPETVKLMATSHLADSIEERSWLPNKGQVGFGIDFAVRLRPPVSVEENNGVVGEFFWDGAASTLFWVDPVNELTAVMFVQLFPYDRIGLHKAFRDAVYGSVVLENE